jgi:SEC-C motif-containing protein
MLQLQVPQLQVLQHLTAGDAATVAFIARSKLRGRAQRMRETSRFVREQGRWFYLDGDVSGGANGDVEAG